MAQGDMHQQGLILYVCIRVTLCYMPIEVESIIVNKSHFTSVFVQCATMCGAGCCTSGTCHSYIYSLSQFVSIEAVASFV